MTAVVRGGDDDDGSAVVVPPGAVPPIGRADDDGGGGSEWDGRPWDNHMVAIAVAMALTQVGSFYAANYLPDYVRVWRSWWHIGELWAALSWMAFVVGVIVFVRFVSFATRMGPPNCHVDGTTGLSHRAS